LDQRCLKEDNDFVVDEVQRGSKEDSQFIVKHISTVSREYMSHRKPINPLIDAIKGLNGLFDVMGFGR